MHRFIRILIREWKVEAKVKERVGYKINYVERTITLATNRPGYLVGRAGVLIEKYENKMRENWSQFKNFYFVDLDDMV
jgi:ribosomal protein S3